MRHIFFASGVIQNLILILAFTKGGKRAIHFPILAEKYYFNYCHQYESI